MKKLTNTLLALTTLAAIAFGATDGFELIPGTAAFIIGLMVAIPCAISLIKRNTNWIEEI